MNAIRLCRPWALPLALMLGSLVGWGALALVAWGQALPDGEQDAPEIAYDSTQNCFFAVYEEVAGGIGGISAAGASFSEAGTAVGNGFTVADETVDRSTPSVAFDPTTGKFLVVWTETSAVWGQLVTGATAATGPVIGVNTTGGNPATLDVAANSVSGGYLVAWMLDPFLTLNIYARRFDAGGAPLDAVDIAIVGAGVSPNKTFPAVAFDSVNERYLVVYDDNNSQIIGVLVDGATGNTTGVAMGTIAFCCGAIVFPDVAFDSANQRFLVVWENTPDVEGQLLDADGAAVGAAIAFASSLYTMPKPAVAYDPINSRYLVVWSDVSPSSPDIVGQLLDGDGNKVGGVTTLIEDTSAELVDAAVAANELEGGFLVMGVDSTVSPNRTVNTFVSGAVRTTGPGPPPWAGYALIGLAAAGLLMLGWLSRAGRTRRLRPATATAIAVVLLNVAILGVVACGGSGSGSSGSGGNGNGGTTTIDPCPL